MKKYLLIILVLLLTVLGIFFFRPQTKKSPSPSSSVPSFSESLPLDWQLVSSTDKTLKIEKSVASGLKPEIVYKKTSSSDALTPAKYVDNLKAGAKSTLPTLRYLTDKRNSTESAYTALLTAYYFNKGKKILISQRLFIHGEDVYTLTASYEQNSSEVEVNSIFDSIASHYLPNQ